jgi:hypothetical protein
MFPKAGLIVTGLMNNHGPIFRGCQLSKCTPLESHLLFRGSYHHISCNVACPPNFFGLGAAKLHRLFTAETISMAHISRSGKLAWMG